MNDKQRTMMLQTIREHHQRITDRTRDERAPSADVGFDGPMRLVTDNADRLVAVVIARPSWWDNPDDLAGFLRLAQIARVPLWRIVYDPETLEPIGAPELTRVQPLTG